MANGGGGGNIISHKKIGASFIARNQEGKKRKEENLFHGLGKKGGTGT